MNSYQYFEGWDVSLAINHLILVVIRTTIRMRDFYNAIYTTMERDNLTNFVGSTA